MNELLKNIGKTATIPSWRKRGGFFLGFCPVCGGKAPVDTDDDFTAYPAISDLDSLLIKYEDPTIVEYQNHRWDYLRRGTYEIIEIEPYEQKLNDYPFRISF